ncbi:MAG: pilin, partial [Bacteroidales bacterium]
MFLSLNQYCNFKNITLLLIVFACCLNFSQGLVVEAVTNSYEVIEFQTKNAIEELVKYLVLWAFRLAGLFAFIMIIYAGFQYLTAGGNVEQQKEAQERIINTFIGIVLLFSFWLILNTINPNLLKTTPEPKPTTVKPPIETEQLPVIVGDFVLIGAGSGKYSNIPLSWEFPNGAYIEESVAESLLKLVNSNAPKGWQVTEACVSVIGNECITTVHHVSNCHKIGTCVDVGFGKDP